MEVYIVCWYVYVSKYISTCADLKKLCKSIQYVISEVAILTERKLGIAC